MSSFSTLFSYCTNCYQLAISDHYLDFCQLGLDQAHVQIAGMT